MRNLEMSNFGENDKPQEGEETRDIGKAKRKPKSPEKSLKDMMDALSGGKVEVDSGVQNNESENLRQQMDEFTEKSNAVQENDVKEAEKLSKDLKEQMGEGSGV